MWKVKKQLHFVILVIQSRSKNHHQPVTLLCCQGKAMMHVLYIYFSYTHGSMKSPAVVKSTIEYHQRLKNWKRHWTIKGFNNKYSHWQHTAVFLWKKCIAFHTKKRDLNLVTLAIVRGLSDQRERERKRDRRGVILTIEPKFWQIAPFE